MSLFVLDTGRDLSLLKKDSPKPVKSYYSGKSANTWKVEPAYDILGDKNDYDCGGLPPPHKDISHIINKYKTPDKKQSKDRSDLDSFARSMGWDTSSILPSSRSLATSSNFLSFCEEDLTQVNVAKLLQGNQMQEIEKKQCVEQPSKRKKLKLMREQRDKTRGKDWFNMPATELTEDVENDLKILQMRSALNPKHFYKKNDLKVLPKYFQVGKVEPSALDYYKEKDIKKSKKKSLVEELLANAEFQKYNKRKFKEVMEKKQKSGYKKAYKKMQKLKKK
uniref:Putative fcf2 pre-rrna processing n=1 Tax=Tabanus bromius TaxID=304241 RepID=A0A0K8TRM2_TABBR